MEAFGKFLDTLGDGELISSVRAHYRAVCESADDDNTDVPHIDGWTVTDVHRYEGVPVVRLVYQHGLCAVELTYFMKNDIFSVNRFKIPGFLRSCDMDKLNELKGNDRWCNDPTRTDGYEYIGILMDNIARYIDDTYPDVLSALRRVMLSAINKSRGVRSSLLSESVLHAIRVYINVYTSTDTTLREVFDGVKRIRGAADARWDNRLEMARDITERTNPGIMDEPAYDVQMCMDKLYMALAEESGYDAHAIINEAVVIEDKAAAIAMFDRMAETVQLDPLSYTDDDCFFAPYAKSLI